MHKGLDESLSYFADRINECVRSEKSIMITTHSDCDGLAAGGIAARALIRAGAACTVSAEREFNSDTVSRLGKDTRDFHVIFDLGGGFVKELDEKLDREWIIVDHHEAPESDLDDERVINAWRFGIDGGREISSGGMAYLAATAIDEKNSDLAAAAVIAALGDGQDAGEKRSLLGKNLEIAKKAEDLQMIETSIELLLVGRGRLPLPDALASTTRPFIEGLTWNRDACASMLESAGISLKDGARMRVPAELSEDEKRAVDEAVARHVSNDATACPYGLVGRAYDLAVEDRNFSDGREFAGMIDACGRTGRTGLGVALCMGEQGAARREAAGVFTEYRENVKKHVSEIINEKWRMSEHEFHVVVNGEGAVPEEMAGTVSVVMAGSPRSAGKIAIVWTSGKGSTVRFSARKSPSCTLGTNLGRLMKDAAAGVKGTGGGHDAAAWAKTTKNKLGAFLDYVSKNVADLQGAGDDT